jgi:superfamily II DNA or RNA helicase
MELRSYQQRAIDELRQALGTGKRRPVVQSPTGSGKTVIAAAIVNMARGKDKRIIFAVPALSLIDQTVERFRQNGIFEIGVMQGQHEMTDYDQPVQVCSVQTLARRQPPKADLVIIDECFSAGTMILTPDGEKPIETFVPGDRILCATGEGHVVGVSSKMSKTMTLRFSNGRSARVTPEHPFFTGAGWVQAQNLGVGQDVFSEEGLRSLWKRNGTKNIPKWSTRSRAHLEQAGILLDILLQEACQPNEQECGAPQNARNLIEDQARSYFSRRERSPALIAAISASSCFGRRLASGGGDTDKNGAGFGLSDKLQVGHSQCGNEVGNRDRWSITQWPEERIGSEKDRIFGDLRLESITFDERASDELVFNLHVSGHPSYFAEGILVHNCHVMFKLYDDWMNRPEWQHVPFIGLTATPWAKGMGAPGRWDHLIIGSTLQELIELGHLSDFRCYAPAHPDLAGVKTVAGDYDLKGLGHAMDKAPLVADIVTTWLERGENRSTICFAVNRVHAKHIQNQFIDAGVKAEYMDAYTDLEDRGDIVRRFSDGDVQVICNVGVLTTGFDADVRCIILARPTKSEILYVQMIGRGLRTADGKADCMVLDHSDTTLRLGFVTDIGTNSLHDGTANRQAAEKTAPLPKECPQCAFLKPRKLRKCPSCGFEAVAKSEVESQDGELLELTRDKKVKAEKFTMHEKQIWYSELLLHAHLRGYKPGWAYWAYKDKFKVGPDHSLDDRPAAMISYEVQNWITARNIRKAKAREKAA